MCVGFGFIICWRGGFLCLYVILLVMFSYSGGVICVLEMYEYIFCVSSVFMKLYFYLDIIFVIRCYVFIVVNLYFNVVNMIVY